MKTMGATTEKQENYGPIDKSDFDPGNETVMNDDGTVDWEAELKKRVGDEDSEVEQRVEAMVEKYDGLVSIKSAPILVGRSEYDIDLPGEVGSLGNPKDIEVANIVNEMRSLNIRISIKEVQDPFSKDGANWEVTNVVVADTSGETQIPFWNEDSDRIQELNLKGGFEEELVVEGAYTQKESEVSDYHKNMYDAPPIEIGDSTVVKIVYPDGEEETVISSS